MKITVLGDGAWGTTLAILLKNKGFDVSLWGAFKDNIESISKARENTKFLPGIRLPDGIHLEIDIDKACKDTNLIVFAIPSRFLREILAKNIDTLIEHRAGLVSVIKGLEQKTLKRMSEVLREFFGDRDIAVLSGPSIAPEVARGLPTAVVSASADEAFACKVRDIFRTERFRVYTNTDIIGVELGGALKNIIAIAAGISDGLGFGANAKAALVTRGLAEITRLGVALGASKETFKGLSGLGDLVTTTVSPEGRNRSFGEAIGRGEDPERLLKKTVSEIEGVWTSRAALELGKLYKIDLPITQQVYLTLFEKKNPLTAVNELMLREPKPE